jgi:hypothetical protein
VLAVVDYPGGIDDPGNDADLRRHPLGTKKSNRNESDE